MVNETRKIMGDATIDVSPTCVRVPVPISHSESILVETERPITPEQAREIWSRAPGVTVVDDPARSQYPLAAAAAGKDDVFVGRIRQDLQPAQRPALLVRQRQPPQGGGDQRRPDRREAARARARPRLSDEASRAMRNIKLTLATTAPTSTAGSASRAGGRFSRSSKTRSSQLTGARPATNASGRTDAGVHALGQVGPLPDRLAPPDRDVRPGPERHAARATSASSTPGSGPRPSTRRSTRGRSAIAT